MTRRLAVVMSVVLLHLGLLWALQGGMRHRQTAPIISGRIITELLAPPAPVAEPPRPAVRRPASARRTEPARHPTAAPKDTPAPPPEDQPAAVPQAVPPAPAPTAEPAAAATAPAPAAPVRLQLPSSSAAYLNNPLPAYPALSRRLGEQGRVMLRVLISSDGRALKAEIQSSSGYGRLDQAALATVLQWRFVPGTRDGVPTDMWFNVPISFLLD